MGWLESKVALITGGASGIGAAVAERFVAEGARVCVMDLSAERTAPLVERLGREVAIGCVGDVTRYEDNARAVAAAVQAFGRLDTFVGNAGVFDGFIQLADTPPEVFDEAFDHIFHVNVKGCLLGARAALPELLETGGNMIFTISGAAFYPDGGGPFYTASKHAVLGLIRELAFELSPVIRVNGVAPGGTVSNLTPIPSLRPHVRPQPFGVSREEGIRRRNPLRITMTGEDHTGAYVLLASDQSRAITGAVIQSDGGLEVRGCWPGEAPTRSPVIRAAAIRRGF